MTLSAIRHTDRANQPESTASTETPSEKGRQGLLATVRAMSQAATPSIVAACKNIQIPPPRVKGKKEENSKQEEEMKCIPPMKTDHVLNERNIQERAFRTEPVGRSIVQTHICRNAAGQGQERKRQGKANQTKPNTETLAGGKRTH
jgi:hypothetical protein